MRIKRGGKVCRWFAVSTQSRMGFDESERLYTDADFNRSEHCSILSRTVARASVSVCVAQTQSAPTESSVSLSRIDDARDARKAFVIDATRRQTSRRNCDGKVASDWSDWSDKQTDRLEAEVLKSATDHTQRKDILSPCMHVRWAFGHGNGPLIRGLNERLCVAEQLSRRHSTVPMCHLYETAQRHSRTVAHFTFWISLSLSVSLSPIFGLRPEISQKVKSFFVSISWAFSWGQTSEWAIAESKANLLTDWFCIGQPVRD